MSPDLLREIFFYLENTTLVSLLPHPLAHQVLISRPGIEVVMELYPDWSKWDLYWVSRCPALTPHLIDKLFKICDEPSWLDQISSHPSLTPWLIEKYQNRLRWYSLSGNSALHSQPSTDLLDRYQHRWDWDVLSETLVLSAELVERFILRWNWNWMAENPTLKGELLELFLTSWPSADNFEWYSLSSNPNLTEQMIKCYQDEWDWFILSENPCLTIEVIELYQERWDWFGLTSWFITHGWTVEQLRENYEGYYHLLNLTSLCGQAPVTQGLIDQIDSREHWTALSTNPNLTPELIERYEHLLNWDKLSRNSCLTPELVQLYEDRWNWKELSDNPVVAQWGAEAIEYYRDRYDPPQRLGQIGWRWDKLSYQILAHNWTLILDHPEWPWCW